MAELGKIVNLDYRFGDPINITIDMSLNELTFLVGPNGSGKTLVLKFQWFIASVAYSLVMSKNLGTSFSTDHLTQYLFDNTFVDPEDFTGEIIGHFENATVQVTVDEGKIVGVIENLDKITSASSPVFMSKDMRTFENLDQYIKVKESLDNPEDIMKFYKLYDSMFAEQMIVKAEKGHVIPEELKNMFKMYNLDKLNLDSLTIIDGKFHYVNTAGESKKLSKLSAGEQSLIVMFLGSQS